MENGLIVLGIIAVMDIRLWQAGELYLQTSDSPQLRTRVIQKQKNSQTMQTSYF